MKARRHRANEGDCNQSGLMAAAMAAASWRRARTSAGDRPASAVGAAGPELLVLVRDAALRMRSNQSSLTEAAALERWIEDVGEPASELLRAAYPQRQLVQMRAPSDVELELLEDGAQPLGASRFGAALQAVASELVAGLRPTQLPGNVADGMELVVRWLNGQSSGALDGW